MPAAAILEQEIDLLETNGRRAAHLVVPHDDSIVQCDAPLLDEPVGGSRIFVVRLPVHVDATDVDVTLRIATHEELRAAHVETTQSNLADQDRLPRHRCFDPRQRKHFASAAIEELELGKRQRRTPAVPSCVDAADGHIAADALGNLRRDVVAKAADVGHDNQPHRQHQQQEDDCDGDERDHRGAEHPTQHASRPGRN